MYSCSLIRAFLMLCDPVYRKEAQSSHQFLPQLGHVNKTSHILKYDFLINSVCSGIMIIFNAFKMEILLVFDRVGTNKHHLIYLYLSLYMYIVSISHRECTVLPFPVPSSEHYYKICLFFPTQGQMLLYCTTIALFLKIIM